MKFILNTKEGLKEYQGELTMVTYDIYFETFRRDLIVDGVHEFTINGAYSRAYLLRVIYAMIRTVDFEFMDFYAYLTMLEDNIVEFMENLNQELVQLITSKLTNSQSKELENDKITN